jgi:phage baseplate assembly protein V
MNIAELNRQLENLIRIGTIAVVDHAARKLKVKSGNLLSNWLDWPADIGRNYKRWRPLRLNTQVILSCPAGDPAQAMIIGMLYSNDFPAPSTDPDIDLIAFNNGSFIEYHHTNKTVKLHSAGDFDITAVGNIKINGTRVDIN